MSATAAETAMALFRAHYQRATPSQRRVLSLVKNVRTLPPAQKYRAKLKLNLMYGVFMTKNLPGGTLATGARYSIRQVRRRGVWPVRHAYVGCRTEVYDVKSRHPAPVGCVRPFLTVPRWLWNRGSFQQAVDRAKRMP